MPLKYVLDKFGISAADLFTVQIHVFKKCVDRNLVSSVSTGNTSFLYQDTIEGLIVIPLSVLAILILFDRNQAKIKTLPSHERRKYLQILQPLRYALLEGPLSIKWNEKNFDGEKPKKPEKFHQPKMAEKTELKKPKE